MILIVFQFLLHLLVPVSSLESTTFYQIKIATNLIRNSNIQQGIDILQTLHATLDNSNEYMSLIKNNLAATFLIDASDTSHNISPIKLLRSSHENSLWCGAPVKNLRWAIAALKDSDSEIQYDDNLNLKNLELHSWRIAVYNFARIGSNDLDRKVHNEMMKDGLTRYLSWCTEDDNKICQSALNIPVTLEYNNTNNVIETNANHIHKICRHSELWINLFDDQLIPTHQHICHPKKNMFTDSKYLDLIFRTVTGYIHQRKKHVVPVSPLKHRNRAFTWDLSYGSVFGESSWLVAQANFSTDIDKKISLTGVQVGSLVLLDFFIQEVIEQNINGDIVEAGVWRGGSAISMAASLSIRTDTQQQQQQQQQRKVWLFDSFSGVPKTSTSAPEIDEVKTWTPNRYAASLQEVQESFRRFGLDEYAIYVKGNFKHTMIQKNLPKQIAILRIDVDSYEGTKIVLEKLYPLVSNNGIIIVDDYHLKGCRTAIHEFRKKLKVSKPLYFTPIDSINTCDLTKEQSKLGLNEIILNSDVDVTFRSGPQVVYWRK